MSHIQARHRDRLAHGLGLDPAQVRELLLQLITRIPDVVTAIAEDARLRDLYGDFVGRFEESFIRYASQL